MHYVVALTPVPHPDCHPPPACLPAGSEGLEAASAAAFAAFGGAGVDYIVHNAGASQHSCVEEASAEVAAALLALNLQGPLALARASLPAMLARGRGGRHVVVASMSGEAGGWVGGWVRWAGGQLQLQQLVVPL